MTAILAAALAVYVRATGAALPAAALLKIFYAGAMCGGGAYLADGICRRSGASNAVTLAASVGAGAALYFVSLGLLSFRHKKRAVA